MSAASVSPQDQYKDDCAQGRIMHDPTQAHVVAELERIYQAYTIERKRRTAWWAHWWRPKRAVKGAYIWGPVGRGKTYCLDLFCQALGGQRVWRVHYHAFMLMIHESLQQVQGCPSPMQRVMRDLAKRFDVLCVDEFLVHDITDAMLLHAVLEGLTREGMSLIVTGNTAPDDLYRHGLQRVRFLPAIAWLKTHLVVLSCDHGQDFRRLVAQALPVYFTPLGAEADQAMTACFQQLAGGVTAASRQLEAANLVVEGRDITTVACAKGVVWLDFDVLCRVPRSKADYLALSKQYDAVLVSDVPRLSEVPDGHVINFIHMVDIFYDAGTRLIVSAAAEPDALYLDGPHANAFERTRSRLHEMRHRA